MSDSTAAAPAAAAADPKADAKTEVTDLSNDVVVTKYKLAGELSTKVLAAVVAATVPGITTVALCKLGDELILKETGAVFNKKVDGKVPEKGIGFPTCVSINHIIGHNSPLASEPTEALKEGDVVKIDLGVHIDGFVAPVATTVVVGASAAAPVTGRKADAILAAYTGAEVALRLCKGGARTDQITAAINKVAKDFHCTPVEGMTMYRVQQNKIAGDKVILQNPTEQHKKDHKESAIETLEAYAIDVIMSTGEGKGRASERKTTVYRKTETTYQLRMKTSRQVFSEISKKFTAFPFTVRSCEDEKRTLLGLTECAQHNVVDSFAILTEREGEFVAEFKSLVLLLPNGNVKASTGNFDVATVKSEFALADPELVAIYAEPLGAKNKKKKAKAAAAGESAGDAPPALEAAADAQ